MAHEWKKFENPLKDMAAVMPELAPKSDVYFCEKCNQICLAQIGQPINEEWLK
jgi:hypothetical protein